jgi:hypothetical protein
MVSTPVANSLILILRVATLAAQVTDGIAQIEKGNLEATATVAVAVVLVVVVVVAVVVAVVRNLNLLAAEGQVTFVGKAIPGLVAPVSS